MSSFVCLHQSLCSPQFGFRKPHVLTGIKSFPPHKILHSVSSTNPVRQDSLNFILITVAISGKYWCLIRSCRPHMWLQKRHMECRMQPPMIWQLEFHCSVCDDLYNREGTNPTRCKLSSEGTWQLKIFSFQPHKITYTISYRSPTLVCTLYHLRLTVCKILNNFVMNIMALCNQLLHSLYIHMLNISNCKIKRHRWLLTINNIKWSKLSTSRHSIVNSKFSLLNVFTPI